MVKPKVVEANLIYEFVVDKIFIWSYLDYQIFILHSRILIFKFWNFKQYWIETHLRPKMHYLSIFKSKNI
jgi:hypothetical protein